MVLTACWRAMPSWVMASPWRSSPVRMESRSTSAIFVLSDSTKMRLSARVSACWERATTFLRLLRAMGEDANRGIAHEDR